LRPGSARPSSSPFSYARATSLSRAGGLVSSIEESVAWFESLGWNLAFRWPDDAEEAGFAGVHGDHHAELFLCRGAQDARGGWVGSPAEVDEAHALALRLGYEVSHPPTDEPWGVREFHLRHPEGHTFRIGASSRS
jgi:catechol 2,3-dioxygenase-like lactoylglutathione lyase family enzyme